MSVSKSSASTALSVPNVERITLRPPDNLDFESTQLAHKWRRWKEEMELYMDLAMAGKDELTKTKLFLYLIGSKGREVYETMTFESPVEERSLKQVMEAFGAHCDPKKNETVERYRFFIRKQETSEPLEEFITDLKLLAATCNFGSLKDSLVRDRIICGVRDKQLREDLLKDPNLDIERCINACRAAELSKERRKMLEDHESINAFRQKTNKSKEKRHDKSKNSQTRDGRNENAKKFKECKYCGRQHEPQREKCPAFGKTCRKCEKKNHFAKMCLTKSTVNAMATDSESDDDEYCLAINDDVECEVINNHLVSDHKLEKKLFATIHVERLPVKGTDNVQ